MSNDPTSSNAKPPESARPDLIWGGSAIARELGLKNPQQLYNILRSSDALDGVVHKLNNKVMVASRRAIAAFPTHPHGPSRAVKGGR